MEYKKVVLGLSDLSNEGVMTLGGTVAQKMTGNPNFASPPVTPVDLQKAVDDMLAIFQKANQSRSVLEWTLVREQREKVERMLVELGDYVELTAKGSESMIQSAGMKVTKTREKHPTPSQVDNIVAEFTGIPGTIKLIWARPKFGKMFRVYMTTTPNDAASWKVIDTVATRKLMVQNLASGTRFYFKVVPVNAAGVGPDSEIAEGIAA